MIATSLGLDAVCERHGITLSVSPQNAGVSVASDGTRAVSDYSAVFAVCALLKMRYRITTGEAPTVSDRSMWMAYTKRDETIVDVYSYHSELAAVVALADRLACASPRDAA